LPQLLISNRLVARRNQRINAERKERRTKKMMNKAGRKKKM
jgi:hypothetical protein